MKFSDILASTIHDMKNGLGLVINSLDELDVEEGNDERQRGRLAFLKHEAQRLNNNLIELLTLYKLENQRISANINEMAVGDFLDDIVVDNQSLADTQGVRLEHECEPGTLAYLDDSLIRGVLNNLIENSMRYTRSTILLTGEPKDGGVEVCVHDDGSGYPQSMIDNQSATDRNEAFSAGHTQLGLYFADKVLALHHNRDKRGYTRIFNGGRLGGGVFAIWIP